MCTKMNAFGMGAARVVIKRYCIPYIAALLRLSFVETIVDSQAQHQFGSSKREAFNRSFTISTPSAPPVKAHWEKSTKEE